MTCILSASSLCAFSADGISVTLDGETMEFDKPAKMINDRVMVPMRKAFEAMDAQIQWDGETSSATAIKDALYVKFTDDKEQMELGVLKDGRDDGEQIFYDYKQLDSKASVIDGTMYIPMRALAESFHYTVSWDEKTNCVEITTPKDAEGWIYYSSWSDGGHMYKSDTNGQNRQLLSTDDCYSEKSNFSYGGGYIFYSIRDHENPDNEGALYRIKTDGTGKEKLTENSINVLYDTSGQKESYGADKNGNLFFIKGTKDSMGWISSYAGDIYLYKLNAKTGEITQLIDAPVANYPIYLYGDYIFFRYASSDVDKSNSFFRVDTSSEEIVKVTGDIAVSTFNFEIENDKLIFSSGKNNYTADLDGSNVEVKEKEPFANEKYDLLSVRGEGDGFAVGIKQNKEVFYNSSEYSVVDDKGNVLSVIKAPEGYRLGYGVVCINNKIYYTTFRAFEPDDVRYKTIYVSTFDELLDMKNINIGEELEGDKLLVNVPRTDEELMEYFNTQDLEYKIHSVNTDGSEDKIVLENYDITGAYKKDNSKLLVADALNFEQNKTYIFDPESGDMEEYTQAVYTPEKPNGILNENVHYGIVVNKDGTVYEYEGNRFI